MNPKQLGILLFLVVVLGGAGLVLYRHQNASWKGGDAQSGQKLLRDFPVNDVACISIRQGTNELSLVKQADQWRVRERNDYPANFSQIRDFLVKAAELKIVQSEAVSPSQLARLQLAAPGQGTNSALVVEFRGPGNQPIRTLWLGKQHLKKSGRPSPFGEEDPGWPDGRYVKSGDSEAVAVISDPLENIEPKPDAWLDKDFIRVEKPKSVEVVFPNGTNSWKLTRETEAGDWKLADMKPGEQLDSSKITSVSNPLSSPSFLDVLPGGKLDETGTNPPTVLTLETFDDFKYTVRVGRKANDDYLVAVAVAAQVPKERVAGKDEKPEDKPKLDKEFKEKQEKLQAKLKQEQTYEKWIYRLQSWSLEPLLKERSQLLVDKDKEPKNADKTSTDAGGKSVPTIETNASPSASPGAGNNGLTNSLP